MSELEKLGTDMLGQMNSIEESWDEATNNDKWLQTDGAEEKKTLARTVRDSRSCCREALKKIGEFLEEETAWRRHDDAATLQFQEWEEGTNAEDIHTLPTTTTGVTSKQQQGQLLKSPQAAEPDLGRTRIQKVAEGVKTWSVLRKNHITQLSGEKLRISQRREAESERSTKGKRLKMLATIRLIPRSSLGKEPFE